VLNESDASSGGVPGFLRRHIILILVVVAVLGGGAWFVHRAKQQNAQNTRPQFGRNNPNNVVAVSVGTVQTGDIVVRVPALGAVTALTTVTVQSQISGYLQSVNFKEGQLVPKGYLLAQVDPRPYEASLAQAKATLARDEALLTDARLDMKRYEDLLKQDSIAEQQIDTQRATVGQDEGNVAADQAAVRTAELNLNYTHITAPVAGRVGLRQIDPGNYVTPSTAIVVVTQLQPMSVVFAVPEDNVDDIMKQLHAGATLPVEAYSRNDATKVAEGALSTTDNEIDTSTGTLKLRALFDNKDLALFPGQFVNVKLVLNTLKDQIVMPTAAARQGAPNGVQSAFVYLVNQQDNTVSVRPVVLGTMDGERVVVKSGLEPNDVVVTEGGDRLRDGATVQLPEATSAELAKAQAQKQAQDKLEEQSQADFEKSLTPQQRKRFESMSPEQRKRFEAFRRRRGNGNFGPPGGFRGPPGGGPPPG